MRLDHLLSKENIVFVLSPGCWLVPGGDKFLFSGEDRYRTHFMCVVLGVDETKRGLCFRGFAGQQMCLCLVFDGLFCFVACCWVSRAARVLFYGSPLVGKAFCWVLCVGWCVV